MEKKDFQYLNHLFEPLVVIDRSGNIQYYNYYFSSFTQYSPRILKKMTHFSNLFFSCSLDINKFLEDVIESKIPVISNEIQISFKDLNTSTHDIVMKAVPIGEDILVCFHDLSVEKRLHEKYRNKLEELRRSHAQLMEIERTSSINELINGISHDINNTLAIASGNSEVIGMYLNENDINTKKDILIESNKELQSSLIRINEIILNMKRFASLDDDKKEYCQMEDVIDDAIDLVKSSFKKNGYKIIKEVPDEDIISLIHRFKIEEILVNLLENALYAMNKDRKKDGIVTIKMYQNEDDFATIDLDDNGPGIPENIRDKIFNTFFSTKQQDESSGVGLAVSSKIIDSHQGSLTLEEKKGNGALFRMRLPIVELGSYLEGKKINNLDMDTETPNKKILVLDDDVKILNILNSFFEYDGHIFIGSTSATNALKILESIDVDLIITEYNIPNMNGSEFIKEVRKKNIKRPIAYLFDEEYKHIYERDKDKYDISDYIKKPFTKDHMSEIIKKILNNYEA